MAVNSEEKYVSLVRNPSFLFFLAEQKASGAIVILPCVCRRDLQFLPHFYPDRPQEDRTVSLHFEP